MTSKHKKILAAIVLTSAVIAVGTFVHYLPEITAFVSMVFKAIVDFFAMVLHIIWLCMIGTFFLSLLLMVGGVYEKFQNFEEKQNRRDFYRKYK